MAQHIDNNLFLVHKPLGNAVTFTQAHSEPINVYVDVLRVTSSLSSIVNGLACRNPVCPNTLPISAAAVAMGAWVMTSRRRVTKLNRARKACQANS